MNKMKAATVATIAMMMLCLSFSAAVAKEESTKAGSVPKGKEDAAKTATAPKPVKDDAAKISGAVKVIKEVAAITKHKIPPVLLKEASAVFIASKVPKQSLMVSGGSAGGILLVHDKLGAWSNPVFITISGGTLGWQIVGDPMDIVLVLKDAKQVDSILKTGLILSTKVAIEPGWLGTTMKGSSAKEQKAEIMSYVRSHGKFAEDAVVAGVKLQVDAAANEAFYSKPKVDVGEIVSGKVVKSTEEIKALQKQLADYAASAK